MNEQVNKKACIEKPSYLSIHVTGRYKPIQSDFTLYQSFICPEFELQITTHISDAYDR